MLLDDPLASVDAHVGKHIFTECILKLLLSDNRTVIMTTHQLHTVSQMDTVALLEEGRVVLQGTPAEVARTTHPLAAQISESSEVAAVAAAAEAAADVEQEEEALTAIDIQLTPRIDTGTGIEKDATPSPPNPDGKKGADGGDTTNTVMVVEGKAVGEVTWSTFRDYISAGGGFFGFFMVLMTFATAQILKIYCDIWVALWAENRQHQFEQIVIPAPDTTNTSAAAVDAGTATSTAAVSGLSIPFVDNSSLASLAKSEWVGYFTILTGSVLLAGVLRTLAFTNFVLASADGIHSKMFSAVMESPSVFFESNPLGRILNRFSNDLDRVDSDLPKQGNDCLVSVAAHHVAESVHEYIHVT